MKLPRITEHYIRFDRMLHGEKPFFLYRPYKGSLSWRFWTLRVDLEYC